MCSPGTWYCSPSLQLLARKERQANKMEAFTCFLLCLSWLFLEARALIWHGMMGTGSPLPLRVAVWGGVWGGRRSDFAEAGAGKCGGVGFSPAASACLKQQQVDERPRV